MYLHVLDLSFTRYAHFFYDQTKRKNVNSLFMPHHFVVESVAVACSQKQNS